MDEVIYLELDEEIPSVIDKMKDLSGKTIALVIPKGASIIQSVINLKILKKEAETLNKDIILVTQDRIGRNLASQVGLSVYDNIRSSKPIINPLRSEPEPTEVIELDLSQKIAKAPRGVSVHDYQKSQVAPRSKSLFKKNVVSTSVESLSKNSDSEYKTPKLPISTISKKKRVLKIILVLLLIAGGIIGAYFYLPRAVINLVLQSEFFETDIEILADNNINQIDESRNAIPGELIEVESEETKTFPATGSKDLGEKASGTIKLNNETGVEQTLVAGTSFTTNGLVFISTESVTVPRATPTIDADGNLGKSPGTATVKVQAKGAGDKYNIGPTNFSVSATVSAESASAMSGGVSKKIKIVTDDDINNGKNELKNILIERNKEEIVSKVNNKQLVESTIIEEEVSFSSNKTINSEADSVEVRLKVRSWAIIFDEENYRAMIVVAINKNVSDDKEVILSSDDEISVLSGNIDFSTGILKLEQNIKTYVGSKIDEEKIKNDIVGKNKTDSETKLREISGVKGIDIVLKPSWWPKTLPKLRQNIQIKKSVEKQ